METTYKDSATLGRARARVAKGGYPLPEKPFGKPSDVPWPSNIADLTPPQLAQHMTWWTGWASYIRYDIAEAETNVAAFEVELKLQQEMGLAKSEGDYKTVTEAKAFVNQSPDIQLLKAKILESKALRKMLGALVSGYEEKLSTTSREISRRSKEFDDMRKEGGRR